MDFPLKYQVGYLATPCYSSKPLVNVFLNPDPSKNHQKPISKLRLLILEQDTRKCWGVDRGCEMASLPQLQSLQAKETEDCPLTVNALMKDNLSAKRILCRGACHPPPCFLDEGSICILTILKEPLSGQSQKHFKGSCIMQENHMFVDQLAIKSKDLQAHNIWFKKVSFGLV